MRCTRFAHCLLLVCLLLAMSGLSAPAARADCPLYRLPTNRFGADMILTFGDITDYDVAALHVAWYSDWTAGPTPLRPGGIEYAQLITVLEGEWGLGGAGASWTALASAVAANPGVMWMIGNEPECSYAPGGGNMTPEQYAAVYHDLYYYIKGLDPTAQIAIGGVVQPTPLRLEWLDWLLTYYQTTYGEPIPVDVWTTHVLILREERGEWGCGIPVGLTEDIAEEPYLFDPEDNYSIPIFQQLVLDFRTWMNARGLRNKPLMITEYGVLMPDFWGATTEVVNAFMTASFDFLLNATDDTLGYPADSNLLVQRWAWNSLNDQPYNYSGDARGFNGNLFSHLDDIFPGTRTAFGDNFVSYTDSLLAGLTGAVCINGTVQLKARSTHSTMATLTLLQVDCRQPDIRSVTTNSSGGFTVCGVLPGTYDVVIKGYNTLANRANAVVLSAGSNVDLGLLRPGDANNDNQVTSSDFSMLSAAYRTVTGDAAYDHRTDFNGDGQVDIRDFSLLATHYSQVGAQAW